MLTVVILCETLSIVMHYYAKLFKLYMNRKEAVLDFQPLVYHKLASVLCTTSQTQSKQYKKNTFTATHCVTFSSIGHRRAVCCRFLI
jgi:hypothetical protein